MPASSSPSVVSRLLHRGLGFCSSSADAIRRMTAGGRPALVLSFGCGIGDDLMCSVIIHEAARRGIRPIWMVTRYPELFVHNPDVDEVVPLGAGQIRLHQLAARRWCSPHYCVYDPVTDADSLPAAHIQQIMCQRAGLTGEVTLKPRLYLTPEELALGKKSDKQIVIHAGRQAMKNKEWMMDRFQTVALALADAGTLIQVGLADDPLLPGVLDLRGRLSYRETAAIMSQSCLYIGQVGLGMHLARAVDCRSVIIYGGRERPDQSGYTANENLYSAVACAPCWLMSRCDHDKRCMTQINAEQVVAAAQRQLARTGEPLPVDTVMI